MLEIKLVETTFYAPYICLKTIEQKDASGSQLLCYIGSS
jgi:hypothetical protein